MTEVYLDLQELGKFPMMLKQNVVVGRECFEFGVLLLDADKCSMYVLNGYSENLLKKCGTDSAICHHQQDSSSLLPRDYEVRLGMPYPHPVVDRYGSFVYAHSVGKFGDLWPTIPSSGFFLCAVVLDFSPIHALDVSVDACFADRGEAPFVFPDPACNCLGRLVVIQMFFHECLQIGTLHNLHGLILCLLSGYIRFMVCLQGIIRSLDFVAPSLV